MLDLEHEVSLYYVASTCIRLSAIPTSSSKIIPDLMTDSNLAQQFRGYLNHLERIKKKGSPRIN